MGRYARQSRSSSPSPQLSWPLQRKMPGMQRLGWEHLNWLGKQTWISVDKEATFLGNAWFILKGGEELSDVVKGRTAVGLVRVVLTVVVSVTDIGRVGADPCATLKLPWPAFELSYNGEKD